MNSSIVYDVLSDFYDKYWEDTTLAHIPLLEKLVLSKIPNHGSILDVCCGTGTIAAQLCEMGYSVDGIDISEGMIEHAKVNAPNAIFTVGDARTFQYEKNFDAVISTHDGFNHITDIRDLKMIFENVMRNLKPGGTFYFDIRNEDGYKNFWHMHQIAAIENETVGAFFSIYEPKDRVALMKVAYFTKSENNLYERHDVYLPQKCYLEDEIITLLTEVGFENVQVSKRIEGIYSDVQGRSHYTCTKVL